ncbi:MAG: sigma-70 family RNA polymerase sigma factor [Fimbriimonadaceae bacterium]|nr:sigma-70 family RNA polymerase sigma factor [Fimbriimonadaceae bacterium]
MVESDDALVARAQRGDRTAFDDLVARYQGAVGQVALRYCGDREEARELAQEAFVRAWLKLHTFQLGRPLRPWLLKVTAGVCLNWAGRPRLSTRSLQSAHESEPELDPAAPASGEPARLVEAAALHQAVKAALLELPPAYRTVMLLRHVEGLEYQDIAAATGQPLGTVKTHLHRARGQLRERLREYLPDWLGETL